MSGRLEVGCQAMVLARPEDAHFEGSYFTGVRGVLVEGPYPSWLAQECWTLEGPEVLARCLERRTLSSSLQLTCVPSSRLVRIDDPDVGLDDGVPADEPSVVGA